MMHQRIVAAGVPGARQRERAAARSNGWCILRMSPGRTLAVADWLNGDAVAIGAWTPRRTFKRTKPGRCNLIDGKAPTVEVSAPILPGFVFAPVSALHRLLDLAADGDPLRPPFSVFTYQGRAPVVGDADVTGLREAEAEEAATLQAMRDAETRAEADRIRIAAMRREQDRMKAMRKAAAELRKALRAERRTFDQGERVKVEQHQAFAGMTGVIESSDGRFAIVNFGGTCPMKIEAWQLVRDPVQAATS